MSFSHRRARWSRYSIALAVLVVAGPASARQWSAVCSDLSGVRVESPGTESAFAEDAVKGATWIYTWDPSSKKGSLTLPASHASDGKAHKQDGVVTSHRGGFFRPGRGTWFT